jgi:tetratricopeptide (TPR) repeat protein
VVDAEDEQAHACTIASAQLRVAAAASGRFDGLARMADRSGAVAGRCRSESKGRKRHRRRRPARPVARFGTIVRAATARFKQGNDMPMIRATRTATVLTAFLLAACAGGPAERDAARPTGDAPGSLLSIPDTALDVLPLEHLLAAEFALREENLDEAASAYLEAARRSGDVEVARRATRVNLSAQRWDDAAVALERWRQLGDEGTGDFQQAQALLALGQGDGERARTLLMELLRRGGMPAARLAGGALEAAPDRGLALTVLQQIADDPALPDDAAVLIGLSQLSLQMERNDLAEALALRASERLPGSPEVWFWRSRLANAAGDTEQARAILEQAVATNPDNPDIRRTYAVLLKTEFGDVAAAAKALAALPPDDETLALRAAYAVEAEEWSEAAGALDALAALPPPRPAGRLLLMGGVAEALAEAAGDDEASAQRRRDEATRWYGEVPESATDDHVRAQQRLAVLDQQSGRLDAALARLLALRERIDPGSPAFADSYLLEAELLDRADRSGDALKVLDAGLAALPDEARLRYARGLTYERLDQVDAALEDFRTLVETNPDNPVYLNAYGYTMADRTTRYEEALGLIERALELNPEDVATIDSMGWVLFKLGRTDEAIDYLRQAYAQQDDGEIAAHLAEALWANGERDEARRILRKAAEADPDGRALKAAIERLKPW